MDTPKEIIDAIIATGMRPAEVSRQTGISEGSISKLRSGRISGMDYARVEKLKALYRKTSLKQRREQAKMAAPIGFVDETQE
jgi:hypothetical protein